MRNFAHYVWLPIALAVVGYQALCCSSAAFAGQPPGPVTSQAHGQEELDRLLADGNAAMARGDSAAAKSQFEQGIALARSAPNPGMEALCLRGIGQVHYRLGQLDAAIDRWNHAITSLEEVQDNAGIAEILDDLGLAYDDQGQFARAFESYDRALGIQKDSASQQSIARALSDLGNHFCRTGQFDLALIYHQSALKIREDLGDPLELELSLNSMHDVCVGLGQSEEALKFAKLALDIERRKRGGAGQAVILSRIGVLYHGMGQVDNALECDLRALGADRLNGGQPSIAIAGHYKNLGDVYDELGQFDNALDSYQSALEIQKAVGKPRDVALCLNDIGAVHIQMDQPGKALQSFNDSLDTLRTSGTEDDVARNYGNIGACYSELHHPEAALGFYNLALDVYNKHAPTAETALCLDGIGTAYHSLGKHREALDFHTRALDICRKLDNGRDVATSLDHLGVDYFKLDKLDQAHQAFTEAERDFEDISRCVADPARLGDLQATLPDLYDVHARTLVRQGRPAEALAELERGKAQGLSRQIALTASDYASWLSPEDASKFKSLTKQLGQANCLLRTAQDRLASASSAQQSSYAALRSQRVTEQQQAERHYTQFRIGLFSRYPEIHNIRGEQAPSSAKLRQLAAGHPDTLYIEWSFPEDMPGQLFALSAGGVRVFDLNVDPKRLARLASDWRAAIAAGAGSTVPAAAHAERLAARAMFDAALEPLERSGLLKPSPFRRLAFVPAGPLLEVPIAALMDSAGNRLIDRFPISTSVAFGMLTRHVNPRRATAGMLCVADPIGAPAQPRVIASRGRFGPLPMARREAAAVAALFPGSAQLIGPEASVEAVETAMRSSSLLHFATHADVDVQNVMRSALILAPGPAGSAVDGELDVRKIIDRPLAASLAVLSACRTASGVARGGEGLMSLAWAFQAAGCPAVVASQWEVDDAATGDLMVSFYRRLKQGNPKDEALRSAILSVRKTRPAPYYWAAFQVIGNTSPLPASIAAK
jgi:CHAT domain-containing protein/predicted negative regulator of RcsB-dependent stress response